MDEQILEMMKRMRQKPSGNDHLEQGVQSGSVTIGGETIEFIEKSLLEDKVKIFLPKNFNIMSQELASLKYPLETSAKLIYTNERASINITFNHTPNALDETEIDSFKYTMIQILMKMQPSAQWLEDGVKNINGKNVGYFDLLAQALDEKVYNLMFFTELEGRTLLGSFNCTEKEMEAWKPVAKEMMESLKVYPGNNLLEKC